MKALARPNWKSWKKQRLRCPIKLIIYLKDIIHAALNLRSEKEAVQEPILKLVRISLAIDIISRLCNRTCSESATPSPQVELVNK